MENRKLISMTAFVMLNHYKADKPIHQQQSDVVRKHVNYANFLSQPLELGMFIPCVDGVPIEKTKCVAMFGNAIWKQAKDKVLFEGFEVHRRDDKYTHMNWVSDKNNSISIPLHKFKTVEKLVNFFFNPTLTQTAIKQIGL
jgi:aromatic ring-cleaving dioxygenase